jgi:hypothetical protein
MWSREPVDDVRLLVRVLGLTCIGILVSISSFPSVFAKTQSCPPPRSAQPSASSSSATGALSLSSSRAFSTQTDHSQPSPSPLPSASSATSQATRASTTASTPPHSSSQCPSLLSSGQRVISLEQQTLVVLRCMARLSQSRRERRSRWGRSLTSRG